MQRSLIPSALLAAALLVPAGLSFGAETTPRAPAETKATSAPKAAEKGAKPKDGKAPAKAKLVDINSAGKKELMTLPGISATDADKIIAGRPYLSKANLTTHNIISRDVYEGLKKLIVAKQKEGTPPKPVRK